MAYTQIVKPNAMFYRSKSSAWKYYERLYDNDETTQVTSASSGNGYLVLKYDMSWLPNNMKLTDVTLQFLYRMTTSEYSTRISSLRYTNSSSWDTSNPPQEFKTFEMPREYVGTKAWHTATTTFTEQESNTFCAATNHLLYIKTYDTGYDYEITLVFNYDIKSSLYPAGNAASALYLGSSPAQMYKGSTKII